jgi:hypothetical protein
MILPQPFSRHADGDGGGGVERSASSQKARFLAVWREKRVESDKKPDLRLDSGFLPQIWRSQNKRQARFQK